MKVGTYSLITNYRSCKYKYQSEALNLETVKENFNGIVKSFKNAGEHVATKSLDELLESHSLLEKAEKDVQAATDELETVEQEFKRRLALLDGSKLKYQYADYESAYEYWLQDDKIFSNSL